MTATASPPSAPPQENALISLGANVFLPILILSKGDQLIENPTLVLVVALAFPAGYFVYDLVKRGKQNLVSIIGFVAVLLTGGIGLLELPRKWVIVGEGTVIFVVRFVRL